MIFIEQNGVTFKLSLTNMTAEIAYSPNANGNIFIPTCIDYKSKQYVITKVKKKAFMNNKTITSINFASDSKIISFGERSFQNSSLQSISIPSSVKEFQNGWCFESKLIYIYLSPQNKNYSYLDNKIVIGKSNKETDSFDRIVFSRQDIKQIKIPSFIKYINPLAFAGLSNLNDIQFSEHSNLLSIEKGSFLKSSLKTITIPKHVRKIDNSAFFNCLNLKEVHFYDDSELELICEDSFAYSSIKRLTTPNTVKQIKSGAFKFCQNIKTFEYLGNDLTIGNHCFSNCRNLFLASFPNVKTISHESKVFFAVSFNFSLFINSSAKISTNKINNRISHMKWLNKIRNF